MAADYIPEKDGDAAVWMAWFAYYVAFKPDAYRTTPQDAEQLVAVAGAYSAAYADAAPSGTKCKSLVTLKNSTRKEAERLIRPAAQRVRTDPQIVDELKVLVGLAPRARRRREIPAPQSAPVLAVSAEMNGVVTLTVSDSLSQRARRPAGAKGMELYERIIPNATIEAWSRGERAPGADAPAWRFIGLQTRTPIERVPPLAARGDQACYVARWVTARGRVSPFGNEVVIRPAFNPLTRATMAIAGDRRVAA
jgi:hypothetical protein